MRAPALAALLLVVGNPAFAADTTPRISWGKPGVSLDDYHADTLTCGRRAAYMDVSHTSGAQALVVASNQIEGLYELANTSGAGGTLDDVAGYYNQIAHAKEAARPAQRIGQVRGVMQGTLDDCLIANGYHRFRLTDDQRHRLGKLRHGSDERRAYLHRLASDPAILTAQALPDSVATADLTR